MFSTAVAVRGGGVRGRPRAARRGARGRGLAAPTRHCQFCLTVVQRQSYKRHQNNCQARKAQEQAGLALQEEAEEDTVQRVLRGRGANRPSRGRGRGAARGRGGRGRGGRGRSEDVGYLEEETDEEDEEDFEITITEILAEVGAIN